MTLATNVPEGMTQDQYNVWWDRYALRNEEGKQIETHPRETWSRVAEAMGDSDHESEAFFNVLRDFKFVPGGRILASAGAGNETMAYNCFVIPVETDPFRNSGADSRDAIMDTINRMVQIMSRGGGVGINWSTLRPRGSHLSRVNGTSSGSVGWMDVASTAVGEVIQGGSRRGAAMFMLWDWHPDILEFTEIKRDPTKVTNANISVAVSDAFMEAVKNDGEWELKFPDTTFADYNDEWDGDIHKWMAAGNPVNVYQTVRARDLWQRICAGAWDNGEPGIVFLDRYNKQSTGNSIEKIICVNPCGEQGLGAYSVCNLGSMNLVHYVDHEQRFNFSRFGADVGTAVRFLDNVIDKSHYMEDVPQTREQQIMLRRIGLGVMGLADVFAALKVRYGSPESVQLTESIFRAMKMAAIFESAMIAKDKGAALGWDNSMIEAPYLDDLDPDLYKHIEQYGLRNLFLTTQAPTGTTSLLAGVNSGIEPFFALEYERNDRMGKRMVRPKPYQDWLEDHSDTAEMLGGETTEYLTKEIPDYFVTANDLSVQEHVAIQAAAQKYIDSSISKTVNAPNSHTVDDVDRLYQLCYDSGLKGISYFREGCNRAVVLSRPKENDASQNQPVTVSKPESRPDRVYGTTTRKRTKYGHAFITVNFADDNGPVELFVNVGRAGSDIAEWSEGYGRLVSLSLRHGVPRAEIAKQLTGVGGYSKMAPSLSTAVGEALMEATMGAVPSDEKSADAATVTAPSMSVDVCMDCGNASVVMQEGCMKCMICGTSKC